MTIAVAVTKRFDLPGHAALMATSDDAPIVLGSSSPLITAIAQLQNLSSLKNDWNGYGAAPLNHQILETAKEAILAMPEQYLSEIQVVPMSHGRVQLEWHQGNRSLEIEFETPTTIRYLKWDPDRGTEVEGEQAATDREGLLQLLQWYAE